MKRPDLQNILVYMNLYPIHSATIPYSRTYKLFKDPTKISCLGSFFPNPPSFLGTGTQFFRMVCGEATKVFGLIGVWKESEVIVSRVEKSRVLLYFFYEIESTGSDRHVHLVDSVKILKSKDPSVLDLEVTKSLVTKYSRKKLKYYVYRSTDG